MIVAKPGPAMDDSPSSSRPSQTPSWVMLGFAIGVLFMLALSHRPSVPPPPASQAPESPPSPPSAPRPLTTIENVFSEWGKYAAWDGDTTEVALWNSGTKDFSDCYEVLRTGDSIFFRSIPRLTRPILRHGVPDAENVPLLFTETAAQREEWLRTARDENLRAFGEALRGGASTDGGPKRSP